MNKGKELDITSISGIMQYRKVSGYGLTDSELRQYFGDVVLKSFGRWIDGQTCAMTEDHQIVVYPEDISRFVSEIKFPGPDFWD